MAYISLRYFRHTQALRSLIKILFISLLIISTACESAKAPREKADPAAELQKSLDSVTAMLFEIDQQTLKTAMERAVFLMEKPEVMVNIPAFESLETAIAFFSTFHESREAVRKEAEYTQQQLKNLQTAISERKMDEQQYLLYIRDEEKVVNNIGLSADYLLNRFNAQLLLLQTLEEAYLQ